MDIDQEDVEFLKEKYIEGVKSGLAKRPSSENPYTYRGSPERGMWAEGHDDGIEAIRLIEMESLRGIVESSLDGF